jgi:hypothetical protein
VEVTFLEKENHDWQSREWKDNGIIGNGGREGVSGNLTNIDTHQI